MSDKTVEKGSEQAGAQVEEVKKEGDNASLSPKEIAELAEALKQSLEREKKVTEERDNYKKGMLKAKGKSSDDENADEGGEEDEKKSTTADPNAELIGLVKTLINRNSELTVTAVNRQQISNASQGAGSDAKVEPTDNLLSAAQLADLKSRGWDDTKISRLKNNLLRTRS